jgi:hypothetical protein
VFKTKAYIVPELSYLKCITLSWSQVPVYVQTGGVFSTVSCFGPKLIVEHRNLTFKQMSHNTFCTQFGYFGMKFPSFCGRLNQCLQFKTVEIRHLRVWLNDTSINFFI